MKRIRLERKELRDAYLATLLEKMTEDQKRANYVRMKEASSWLTSLPRKEENTTFNKREFHDAMLYATVGI